MNSIDLGIFASRIEAVCDEMGAVLRRAAFSPNIKDRLDFSCAVFDARGELCAQAAHIPVHLGSMAFAMRDIVQAVSWREGEQIVLNDPFLGGTHLPDVTVIAPVFVAGQLTAFVVNRAHHANIGADTPGSMPLSSRLEEEGVVIPPTPLVRAGVLQRPVLARLCSLPVDHPGLELRGADFVAQVSANQAGRERLSAWVAAMGRPAFEQGVAALNDYGERLARASLAVLPAGEYHFCDRLEDDGQGGRDIPLQVCVRVASDGIEVDFAGSAPQVAGNLNCPLSVAAAGVYYVFRCLLPPQAPACAGTFRPIRLRAPEGSLLNARRPAAVAAGNVETSMRVVDALMGALAQAIPERLCAAGQGTMNNLAMGAVGGEGGRWDYYETLGGGMGGNPRAVGLSAVQNHMTNTLNTPVESLEQHYPLRVRRYALRLGSGGEGRHRGGDGLVRELEFLGPATVTLLTERRRLAPWGLEGGGPGMAGRNLLNGHPLPAKVCFEAVAGDVLAVETPGGGGWGESV